MQKSAEPVSERASERPSERPSVREPEGIEIPETEEERRRRIKGKAKVTDDERALQIRVITESPLVIREREEGVHDIRETDCNQLKTNQSQAGRRDTNSDVALIPQTEAAKASKHDKTSDTRKAQDDEDTSMEEGKFNKMVDYYNEIGMTDEMVDDDDLLDDDIVVPETQAVEEGSENEQIEVIAQLGRKEPSRNLGPEGKKSKDLQHQNTTLKDDSKDQ